MAMLMVVVVVMLVLARLGVMEIFKGTIVRKVSSSNSLKGR